MLLNRMNDQQPGDKKHAGNISLGNVDSLQLWQESEVTTQTKVFQTLLMLPATHILETC